MSFDNHQLTEKATRTHFTKRVYQENYYQENYWQKVCFNMNLKLVIAVVVVVLVVVLLPSPSSSLTIYNPDIYKVQARKPISKETMVSRSCSSILSGKRCGLVCHGFRSLSSAYFRTSSRLLLRKGSVAEIPEVFSGKKP